MSSTYPTPTLLGEGPDGWVVGIDGKTVELQLDPREQVGLRTAVRSAATKQKQPPKNTLIPLAGLGPDDLVMAATGEVLEAALRWSTHRSRPGPPRWKSATQPRQYWPNTYPAAYPDGVSKKWRNAFVQRMFLHHKDVVMAAVPEHLLVKGMRPGAWGTVVKWLVVEGAARTGGADTSQAQRIYNSRYNGHFTKPAATDLPISEQNGPRFAHELLNGMAPVALLRTDDEHRYRAEFRFTDLSFGDPYGRGHDLYKLPDVDVDIVVADDVPRVVQVRLRYRNTDNISTYTTGGEAAYGPWQPIDMTPGTEPLWRQSAARRITMGAALLTGQLDGHVALGHLAVEWASVALGLSSMQPSHPVHRILAPRLAEVSAVNRFADDIIWGDDGLFATCTALDGAALNQRMSERVAAIDWKGWRPRSACIASSHYAPKVLGAYYSEVVVPYVKEALGWSDERPVGSRMRWFVQAGPRQQMMDFFRRIAEPEVMHAPWGAHAPDDWLDSGEFVSRAPGSRAFSRGRTEDDVIELVSFIVFNATLGHSWPNVRQIQCVGDPDFASPSLTLAIHEGPQNDDWHSAASPIAADALFMLLTADVLTLLDVDTFGKEMRLKGQQRHDLPSQREVPRDPFLDPSQTASLAERFHAAKLGRFVAGPYDDPLVSDPDNQLSRCNR